MVSEQDQSEGSTTAVTKLETLIESIFNLIIKHKSDNQTQPKNPQLDTGKVNELDKYNRIRMRSSPEEKPKSEATVGAAKMIEKEATTSLSVNTSEGGAVADVAENRRRSSGPRMETAAHQTERTPETIRHHSLELLQATCAEEKGEAAASRSF